MAAVLEQVIGPNGGRTSEEQRVYMKSFETDSNGNPFNHEVTVDLPADMFEAIRGEAVATGLSESAVLREMLRRAGAFDPPPGGLA